MLTVFEKLRLARERKGISIDDIALYTRIHSKMLHALEEGNLTNIPQTYVRAFLRAYAREVGLEDSEILREYEAYIREATAHEDNKSGQSPQPHVGKSTAASPLKYVSLQSQNFVSLAVGGVLVVALTLSLILLNTGGRVEDVQKGPPSTVVQQKVETPQSVDSPPAFRSSGPTPRVVEKPQTLAPLVLRAMTFDSAWISIMIDGKTHEEHHVPPRWSMQWRAQDSFTVSLDDASAVTFVLNNAPLGFIGESGQPVENYHIGRAGASPQQVVPQPQ
jgi:transcriptional regulator with XRE-family HTH domain